jgi:hypothetical protein
VLFPAAALTLAGLSLARFGFGFLLASVAQKASRKVIARSAPSYPDPAKRMHVTGKVKGEARPGLRRLKSPWLHRVHCASLKDRIPACQDGGTSPILPL